MSFQGTLTGFGPTEIIQMIGSAGKSGCLTVVSKEGEARLHFLDGSLVAGGTAGSTATTGEALVEAVGQVLAWDEANYEFDDCEPVDCGVGVCVPAQELVEAVEEAQAQWEEVRKSVGSVDVIARLTGPGEGAVRGDGEDSGDGEEPKVVVSLEEWEFIRLLAGSRSLRDVKEEWGRSSLEVCRTAASLIGRGLAAIGDSEGTPSEDVDLDESGGAPGECAEGPGSEDDLQAGSPTDSEGEADSSGACEPEAPVVLLGGKYITAGEQVVHAKSLPQEWSNYYEALEEKALKAATSDGKSRAG